MAARRLVPWIVLGGNATAHTSLVEETAPADGRWDLLLIGNNLSDELILNNGQVFVANAGYLNAPRRVTLQDTYRFSR